MSETKASELFEVGVAQVCIQPGDRERRLSQLKITTVLRFVREGFRANSSNARSVVFQKQKRARTTSYVSYDSAACIARRRVTNLGVTVDAVYRSPWSHDRNVLAIVNINAEATYSMVIMDVSLVTDAIVIVERSMVTNEHHEVSVWFTSPVGSYFRLSQPCIKDASCNCDYVA
ncbi:hypothetical protein JG688_00000676 [Phytophthora aleatoria]|uniref:Uncharacterized protein n=1 Tax=Phytophthora aleatoria TaxID=2496075 RepID=A0A8J5J1M0_9STRA|nr:hypothetical protein JG688_00000676 [Phytophthora aleatoria]